MSRAMGTLKKAISPFKAAVEPVMGAPMEV